VQRDWFLAQARNYPATLDAALDRQQHSDGGRGDVGHDDAPRDGALQRYLRLRKRLLGLETLSLYDSGHSQSTKIAREYPV